MNSELCLPAEDAAQSDDIVGRAGTRLHLDQLQHRWSRILDPACWKRCRAARAPFSPSSRTISAVPLAMAKCPSSAHATLGKTRYPV
jgi:hypothetical protein